MQHVKAFRCNLGLFTEAYYFRQIIDNNPSYFLKNELHHYRLNIFQQIVWNSYVFKFLNILEEKILQIYSNACESLKE